MAAARPLSIAVHTNRLEAVDGVCGAALGCAQSDVLGQLLLLVVTGLLAVFVLAAIQHVREARSAVEEERSRTATEQHAFARFTRAVSRIDASAAPVQTARADGAVATVATSSAPPPDRGLQAVREAYEETVMAMDHYEEEYDEPLARNMGEEFGEDVARAIADGTRLTPPLKEALLERARDAAADRERLMARLDSEEEALEAAGDELAGLARAVEEADGRRPTERTYDELVDQWHRLGEAESRLQRLLDRRQDHLRPDVDAGEGAGRPSLQGYLYATLETTYPILADGSRLAERIRAARSRVLHALTRRA